MRIRALVPTLLVIGLLGCSAERSPFSTTELDSAPLLLAFLSDRPPSRPYYSDILLYDLRYNGPPVHPPSVNTADVEGPVALSADARLMAFFQQVGNTATIALYDVAGRTLLPPPRANQLPFVKNPALSGNGRFLAVHYQLGGLFEQLVAVEDLVADSLLVLPHLNDSSAINLDPSLNGDGSLLAFTSNRVGGSGDFDIYLYSIPGDSLIPLPKLNSTARDQGASISADGRYIAFQSGRPSDIGLINVYVYDRATASLVPLPGANDTLSEVQPAISPDGRYLAYATESSGGRDVWVYDIQARRRLRIEGLNDPYYYDYFPALANLP